MIRSCVCRKLSPELQPRGLTSAVIENPWNHPLGSEGLNLPAIEQAAAVTASRWSPGRNLRVKFLGGDRAAQDEVFQAVAEWSRYANINFTLGATGDAEIRVAFQQGAGSWSYVGTDCLAVPANQPTMNLGWSGDLARTLHEFGHALGLIHEHQNPEASIPWKNAAVIAYYMGPPNNWTLAEVISQVLSKDTRPLTNGGYDRTSIMQYPIDAAFVTDPAYAVPWNQVLSDKDKAFIASILPGRWTPPGTTQPKPGAPGTPSGPTAEGGASIKLHVPTAGDYILTIAPAKAGAMAGPSDSPFIGDPSDDDCSPLCVRFGRLRRDYRVGGVVSP